ncbi:MAG: hypothetical protein GKR77_03665 [Legionellales bacterium]|nr:hypothetical protein [Legionellales bacterium]
MLHRIILGGLMCLLVGCANNYKGAYDFIPPSSESGQTCVANCEVAKVHCEKVCQKDNGECLTRMAEQAQADYEDYLAMQREAGEPVTRNKASFSDNRVCYRRGCDCQIEYRECFQLCGGQLVAKAE